MKNLLNLIVQGTYVLLGCCVLALFLVLLIAIIVLTWNGLGWAVHL